MKTIANTARSIIGVDQFHYAILLDDAQDALAYGEMTAVPNTVSINVNVNSQSATLFADNKAAITYTTIGVVEVSMDKATLPNEFLSEVLGNHTIGAVRHTSSDQTAPYVGIAWRYLYSDGNYGYAKLYKGKFSEPELNANTKEDGVEFQNRSITANFISTEFKATSDAGKEFSLVMATTDETDPNYTNEGTTWFSSMLAPVAAWVTATSYSVGDLVLSGGNVYKCIVAHTSSAAFATDLTAEKWILLGAY